jgi:RNA polymerase-binding protein DksA
MGDSRFSKDFLDGLRVKLEARRHELLTMEKSAEDEALIDLSSETTDEISHVRLHPADLGSTEFDQDLELTLAESEIKEIQDIESALDRIAHGRYGECDECGMEIPFTRLEAVPYTRYCAACETRLEKRHRHENEARS